MPNANCEEWGKMTKYVVAIVGATGAVGTQTLTCLE